MDRLKLFWQLEAVRGVRIRVSTDQRTTHLTAPNNAWGLGLLCSHGRALFDAVHERMWTRARPRLFMLLP